MNSDGSNVKWIGRPNEPGPQEPIGQVVEHLEWCLDLAKRGKVRGIGLVAIMADGTVAHRVVGQDVIDPSFLGGCTALTDNASQFYRRHNINRKE